MGDASVHSLAGPMPPAIALSPTWRGYVADTREALILFEAVLQRYLGPVVRRPHDRERASLIRSGSIFIYEEGASGIKRWTDGVPWSPSRILNNFLIYRELVKPFPPGEKKRANKKTKKECRPGEPYPRNSSSEDIHSTGNTGQTSPTDVRSESGLSGTDKEAERSLIGSLTDSYSFKEDGLVKKTMSVTIDNRHLHLVSYYNPQDVRSGNLLQRPSEDPGLGQLRPRPDLLHRQNFRAPLDDVDEVGTNGYAGSPQRHGQYVPTGHAGYNVMEAGYHTNAPMVAAQQYYGSTPASPYGMHQMQQAPHMQHMPYSPVSRYPDGSAARQMGLASPGPPLMQAASNYYHAPSPGPQVDMRNNYAQMSLYPAEHGQQQRHHAGHQDHYSMQAAPQQQPWSM